jgi:hypothetical protein
MVSVWDPSTRKPRHLAVNACLAPLASMDGCAVTTVEGIGSIRAGVHPLQRRVAELHGSQCGFCTPGIVMAMYTLFRQHPDAAAEFIEENMDGNLCRCTGYRPLLDAAKTLVRGCCRGAWSWPWPWPWPWCMSMYVCGRGRCFRPETGAEYMTSISEQTPHIHTGENGGGCPCKEQSDQDFGDTDQADRDVYATTEGRVADKGRYPALDDATTEPIFPPELALAKPRALYLRSAKVWCGAPIAIDGWMDGYVDGYVDGWMACGYVAQVITSASTSITHAPPPQCTGRLVPPHLPLGAAGPQGSLPGGASGGGQHGGGHRDQVQARPPARHPLAHGRARVGGDPRHGAGACVRVGVRACVRACVWTCACACMGRDGGWALVWWLEMRERRLRGVGVALQLALRGWLLTIANCGPPKTHSQGVEVGGAVTLSRLEHFIAHDEAGFKANGGKDAYKVREESSDRFVCVDVCMCPPPASGAVLFCSSSSVGPVHTNNPTNPSPPLPTLFYYNPPAKPKGPRPRRRARAAAVVRLQPDPQRGVPRRQPRDGFPHLRHEPCLGRAGRHGHAGGARAGGESVSKPVFIYGCVDGGGGDGSSPSLPSFCLV